MCDSLKIQRYDDAVDPVINSKNTRLQNYLEQVNSEQNQPEPVTRKRKQKTKLNSPPTKKVRFDELQTRKQKHTNRKIIMDISQQKASLSVREMKHMMRKMRDPKPVTKTRKRHQKPAVKHPLHEITKFPAVELPQKITDEKELNKLDVKPLWMKNNIVIKDVMRTEKQLKRYKKKFKYVLQTKEKPEVNICYALKSLKINYRLVQELKRQKYTKYLPVQKSVIPAIVRGYVLRRDVLVCSPTGSGKTLAFVLPLVHLLAKENEPNSSSRKLRAIIVLPSRDLALQIFLIIEKFSNCVGLKVGLCNGSCSLQDEQFLLVDNKSSQYSRNFFLVGDTNNTENEKNENNRKCSKIDILVCTPGRLCHHLDHTFGFTLEHLQFLVMDECDKLTNEGFFQDWLFRVSHAIDRAHARTTSIATKHENENQFVTAPLTIYDEAGDRNQVPMKILLSATLNHNPKLFSLLNLRNPMFFCSSVSKKYVLPPHLTQKYIIYTKKNKLSYFLALIETLYHSKLSVVCFCNTVQKAHRLRRMVEIALAGKKKLAVSVFEFSRLIPSHQRTRALHQFKRNRIQFMMCSDAMSRGLDMSDLDCVINYECPTHVETYVHRIGRTARATHSGTAYTLVTKEESHFLVGELLAEIEHGNGNVMICKYKVKRQLIDEHLQNVQLYRKQLSGVLHKEDEFDLELHEPLSF